jgi:oxygen-dependent protoporphyrinogen oxidase
VTDPVDVAVLGGGVTGLAAALRLRALLPEATVALVDAAPKPGGKVCGELVQNCVIDGGPDLCIEAKLARSHAFHELGIGSELIPVNPARLPTFRRSRGQLSALPDVLSDGLVTMRGGMHDIVNMLVSSIPDVHFRMGARVVSVERSARMWTLVMADGSSIRASALICALPANAASLLLRHFSPVFAKAASRIRYVPMTTVSAAWARCDIPGDLNGTGYIEEVPIEGAMTACTWTTSKIPMRSAYDVVLMRGYVRTAATDAATQMAVAEMSSAAGITSQPLWTRAYSFDDAVPQYPAGHHALVTELRAALQSFEDFAFAGAAWDGVGIGDCMCSGESAAERIAAALQPARCAS